MEDQDADREPAIQIERTAAKNANPAAGATAPGVRIVFICR